MKDNNAIKTLASGSLFVALIISERVLANGFAVPHQGASLTSMAYAGSSVIANDATTAFYNPAGLTQIKREHLIAGAVLADSNTFLDIHSATNPLGAALPKATDKASTTSFIPSFHYARPVDENWGFGVSAVSTYGSKNSYKQGSTVRYIATRSEMFTIDLAPSVGYKYNDNLSLGAGLDIYYGEVILDKALRTAAPIADGYLKHKGKGQQLGMHLGALYKHNNTRFGFKYNSRALINFKGEAEQKTNATANVTKQDISAKIDMPESVTLGVYHKMNKLALVSDLQWYHWSRLRNVNLKYADGTAAIFDYYYKNSYRLSVGSIYDYTDKLKLKMGVSYETTPTRRPFRSASVPDGNQLVLALGASYDYSKNLTIDAGYAHVFSNRVAIDQTRPRTIGLPITAESINASAKSHINAISFQIKYYLN